MVLPTTWIHTAYLFYKDLKDKHYMQKKNESFVQERGRYRSRVLFRWGGGEVPITISSLFSKTASKDSFLAQKVWQDVHVFSFSEMK